MPGAYARLFDRVLDDLRERINVSRAIGSTVVLVKGVAALDQLGSYCFTGCPWPLLETFSKPPKTIDSISHNVWSHFRPYMLDLLPVMNCPT